MIILVLLTLLGVTSWVGMAPMANGPAWAVSTMLFFYQVFPALVPRLQRVVKSKLELCAIFIWSVQLIVMCFASFVLFLPLMLITGSQELGQLMYWIRMFPPIRLPVFIMGAFCASHVIRRESNRQLESANTFESICMCCSPSFVKLSSCCGFFHPASVLFLWWLGILVGGSISAGVTKLSVDFPVLQYALELVLPVLFYDWMTVLTLPDADESSSVARCFRSGLFAFFADISMSLYNVHYPIICILSCSLNGQCLVDPNDPR
eukprot:TRINITY_DN31028_c0_g1_i1.p2 TRINITY_DN31028_c0_g1~~TRINITY_DN31028_c0_g1_i1.p2  ORF type:complete len:263 (-),score=26.17 TRINITY_DN31028_c0_g1_i1:243-1031(-)